MSIWIVILVAAVVIGGFVYWHFFRDKTPTTQSNITNPGIVAPPVQQAPANAGVLMS